MENENSIQTDELIEPREEYSISLTAEDMKNIYKIRCFNYSLSDFYSVLCVFIQG